MKKTVVVPGSSRGIGAGIAKTFGARGWDVVVTYVGNVQAADAVVEEIKSVGGTASAIPCNTRNEDDIKSLFETLDRRGATLSALATTPASPGRGRALKTSPSRC